MWKAGNEQDGQLLKVFGVLRPARQRKSRC
jgi:hypothetical protein